MPLSLNFKSFFNNPNFLKIKKYIPYLFLLFVFLRISKTIFFISIFTFIAYQLKLFRGRYGLKMVVLDTLHFSAVVIAAYIGLKEAIIFVLINTIIIDFLTFIASDGTFANFFFYSISTVIGVFLFGKTNIVLAGTIAAIIYAVLYYIYRTYIVPNPFFDVISKCITSIIFTFLYTVFFAPLLKIFMV
ncbi:MAG: hypothetical protein QXR96_01645 [Candidatus Woesearchaeota archaeon]